MSVEAKARRLVQDHRVRFVGISDEGEPTLEWDVEGDHGTYRVVADTFGINCPCRATVRCSHQVAAVLWAEQYGVGWRLTGNIIDTTTPEGGEYDDATTT